MFKPPIIDLLQLTSGEKLTGLTLDTDGMQLAGFMGFREENGGQQSTRYINVSCIEQIIVKRDEQDKVTPCCFVPETRLRVLQ